MTCDVRFGKILTDKLIYSPSVIYKQILDVQTYGTSCLFSLSTLQFEAQMGISIDWKQESWTGNSVCFFGTVCKHIRTPLKQDLLDRSKEKTRAVFPWCSGFCSLIAEETAEAGAATAPGHCAGLKLGRGWFSLTVSPLHSDSQRSIAHCGQLITACVPALVLHTYLLLGCVEWKETFVLDLSSLDHSPQEMWVNIYP